METKRKASIFTLILLALGIFVTCAETIVFTDMSPIFFASTFVNLMTPALVMFMVYVIERTYSEQKTRLDMRFGITSLVLGIIVGLSCIWGAVQTVMTASYIPFYEGVGKVFYVTGGISKVLVEGVLYVTIALFAWNISMEDTACRERFGKIFKVISIIIAVLAIISIVSSIVSPNSVFLTLKTDLLMITFAILAFMFAYMIGGNKTEKNNKICTCISWIFIALIAILIIADAVMSIRGGVVTGTLMMMWDICGKALGPIMLMGMFAVMADAAKKPVECKGGEEV